MDLATLVALYPVAADMLQRTPQLQKWMENKAKKEDPSFFLQLQSLETISELKGTIFELKEGISELKGGITELKGGISALKEGISELKGGVSELKDGISELKGGISGLKEGFYQLRAYTLNTAIMSAMLSNPDLTPTEIKAKFITSAEVSKDILGTIEGIAP